MPKIKVAITGGIGSGKSLAAEFLREQNYPVFSCDEIYKDVIQSSEYLSQIQVSFPSVIIDGKVDIKNIRDIEIEDLLGREPIKTNLEKI